MLLRLYTNRVVRTRLWVPRKLFVFGVVLWTSLRTPILWAADEHLFTAWRRHANACFVSSATRETAGVALYFVNTCVEGFLWWAAAPAASLAGLGICERN